MKKLFIFAVAMFFSASTFTAHAQGMQFPVLESQVQSFFGNGIAPWIQSTGSVELTVENNEFSVHVRATPDILMHNIPTSKDLDVRIPIEITVTQDSTYAFLLSATVYTSTKMAYQSFYIEDLRVQPALGLPMPDGLEGQIGQLKSSITGTWLRFYSGPTDQRVSEDMLVHLLGQQVLQYIQTHDIFTDYTEISSLNGTTTYSAILSAEVIGDMAHWINLVMGQDTIPRSELAEVTQVLQSQRFQLSGPTNSSDITDISFQTAVDGHRVTFSSNEPQDFNTSVSLVSDDGVTIDFLLQTTASIHDVRLDSSNKDMVDGWNISIHSKGETHFFETKPSFAFPTVDETSIMELNAAPSCQSTLLFTDACEHWARDYIHAAKFLGIMEGKTDGNFHPDATITRAEFVTLLTRAYGYNPAGHSMAWSDVQMHDWFNGYMAVARTHGIIQGFNDGTMRPYQPVTRAEAAKMLLKARMHGKESTIEKQWEMGSALLGYRDMNNTEWFTPFVQYVSSHGIANGYEDGTFRPYNNMTRAEAAKIIVTDLLWGPTPASLVY